jgi:hypothetical protein
MTAHALLSRQSVRRKRERGRSHPELDEAAAAGIHGLSAVHLSTTAIVVVVLEHIAAHRRQHASPDSYTPHSARHLHETLKGYIS